MWMSAPPDPQGTLKTVSIWPERRGDPVPLNLATFTELTAADGGHITPCLNRVPSLLPIRRSGNQALINTITLGGERGVQAEFAPPFVRGGGPGGGADGACIRVIVAPTAG